VRERGVFVIEKREASQGGGNSLGHQEPVPSRREKKEEIRREEVCGLD